MIRRRAVFAPFGLVATLLVVVACNEGGMASPSNTPHGSRCLMDTDCMGGYECNKAKGDILGECSQKTMGGPGAGGGAGGGGGGGGAKPAGSGGAGPASSASSGSGKPADPPKGNGKSQTPEPLPPPKPPKDAKPADTSTFSP